MIDMNHTRAYLHKFVTHPDNQGLSQIFCNKRKLIFMPHSEKGGRGVISDSRKMPQRKIPFDKSK